MNQPGPGGVMKFAEEVKRSRHESERTNGIRFALEWVLGESNEHPVASKVTRAGGKPPTMREIRRVRGEARTAQRKAGHTGRRAPRVGSSSSSDYYKGVSECLHWILAGGPQPRLR
jgi:hypothetical protein